MYNTIRPFLVDEKKDIYLVGSLYDSNGKKIEDFIFDDGIKNKIDEESFTIIINEKESYFKKRQITDFITVVTDNAGFVYLLSPIAQKLFIGITNSNIELFDVLVKGNNFKLDGYKVLKICDKIDCIDTDKSDIKLYDDGDLRRIKTIVLDESKTPKEKLIFLLGRRNDAIILIKIDLMELIVSNKLTGFFFQDLMRYRFNY